MLLLPVLLRILVAMLIVVFSHNRVEGMALAKISGQILFGLPVPFLLPGGYQYLFSWLPSFWIAKIFADQAYWGIAPAILVSAAWIWIQYKRFEKKLL